MFAVWKGWNKKNSQSPVRCTLQNKLVKSKAAAWAACTAKQIYIIKGSSLRGVHCKINLYNQGSSLSGVHCKQIYIIEGSSLSGVHCKSNLYNRRQQSERRTLQKQIYIIEGSSLGGVHCKTSLSNLGQQPGRRGVYCGILREVGTTAWAACITPPGIESDWVEVSDV